MVLKPIIRDLNTSIENLRLAWRMPWVRAATVLGLIGYALYAWVLFPTQTARVRIGMDVTINGVTRSASNVVELKSRNGLAILNANHASLRGEAVVLTLGARAAVAMLITPLRNPSPDWLIRQVIAAMGGDLREPIETGLIHVAAQSRRHEFSSAVTEVDGREEHPLQPDVIFLADRRNFQPDRDGPGAWAEVPIHHPDAVLGTSGATVVLWVETVSRLRPVTRGEVTAKLPFFNSFWARNHVSPPAPPALRPTNFKVD
ncbi:hypothetical protein [Phreatobacter stygius]|uniref:Uncharacterized protein n=1 Tax=Phreatobacter stygius TaxID=1940610 RepID=A0A4D7AVF3_9HYPH|nr:hypothetical protein [Phreatobacter stygius]QCI65704.1 hypothetical protein E8M01_16695 [Phreatobacter stygius]